MSKRGRELSYNGRNNVQREVINLSKYLKYAKKQADHINLRARQRNRAREKEVGIICAQARLLSRGESTYQGLVSTLSVHWLYSFATPYDNMRVCVCVSIAGMARYAIISFLWLGKIDIYVYTRQKLGQKAIISLNAKHTRGVTYH